jgi:hypothetical protein
MHLKYLQILMESIATILDVSTTVTIDGFYGHIFDGTPQDTTGYATANIILRSTVSGTLISVHSIDNSGIWDTSTATAYPGSIDLNTALFVTEPLRTKWYKTQFININSSVSADIRLQTILRP